MSLRPNTPSVLENKNPGHSVGVFFYTVLAIWALFAIKVGDFIQEL